MEELKTFNTKPALINLPFYVTADNDDSFQEWQKESIINTTLAQEVKAIEDYEITSFKPNYSILNYDVFFNMYLSREGSYGDSPRNRLSTAYVDYFDQIGTYFDPYVTDIVYPTFWNSLGYPFYTKYKTWEGKPKRFDPQAYVYNSFLKFNFYTTPYPATQQLLFQNVVYVNPRWCQLEGDTNGSWHRPTFKLDSTTDGYYLYWLNDYNIDTFYVNIQFWDALNGRMINLIPSCTATPYKHWVQSVNTPNGFDSRWMYMEYKISYPQRRYTIGEFNNDTKLWDIHSPYIQLYELVFDDDYANRNPNISVQNGVPYVPEPTVTNTTFSFGVNGNPYTPPPQYGHPIQFHFNPPADVETYTLLNSETDPYTFNDVRESLAGHSNMVGESYNTHLIVNNRGAVPFYLKDVQVTLKSESGSTKTGRISDMYKNFVGGKTIYLFGTVPQPGAEFEERRNMSNPPSTRRNGLLQPGFETHYNPGSLNSTGLPSETGSWWESSRLFKWFFPIIPSNFTPWGWQFAELLSVSYAGTDNPRVDPNMSLRLDLSFVLGNNYSPVYFEPMLYSICDGVIDDVNSYDIKLMYNVKLVFNTLTNELPEDANIIEFEVPVTQTVEYKYKRSGSHGKV